VEDVLMKVPTIAAAEALLTPSAYQKLAARTETSQHNALRRINGQPAADHPKPNDSPDVTAVRFLHALIGLAGEAGELAGAAQKWLWYGKSLDTVNVKEELGDLLWYTAQACNAFGLDLGDVMRTNIAKLRARFPDRYTDEAAAEENRNREAERAAVGSTPHLSPGAVGDQKAGMDRAEPPA
jgi:NTP pyrophosphatase (non-canonical NTP hydrolase)